MREIIAIVVCVVVFMVAMQSGMIKTGLDYGVIKKNNENLQATNERLTREIKRMHNLNKDGVAGAGDQVAILERLEKAKADLKGQLAREIKKREIVFEEDDNWLKLVVLDKVLFSKHSAGINTSARQFLLKITRVLSHFDEMEMRITGFTDNQRLAGKDKKKYPTLRHLSAARAITVAEFFQREGDLDPVQIVAAGFGEARPVVPNDSEYHRTLNGRIEISLHPVALEVLNKARDIYRTESLITQKHKKTKQLAASSNEYEPSEDEDSEEAIGEEALDNVNDMEFDAGYAAPDEAVIE
ncbi:OmpA family protein [bacterium]|nr:OmpA family protein [bacterium]